MAKKLLLLFVATAAALALGELITRALCKVPDIKPIWVSSSNCVYRRSSNPLLGFELKPNYRCEKPDLRREYESTNSHGQRDLERSLEKRPGWSRVILLGDSVVEGFGVRETETISRQLEKQLATEKIEVLNFGVSAYCTRSEVELLETKGLSFKPDIVVLVFTSNDFDNFNREAFVLERERDRPTVVKYLFLWSHLFRKAALELNLFGFGVDADPGRWNRRAIGENNVASGLRRLSQLSRLHGFRTVVAVWPNFEDLGIVDGQFMPGESKDLVVERLSRMYGIPVIRLSPAFQTAYSAERGAVSPRLLYTIGDKMHPSPRGCSVAAQALKFHLARLKNGEFSLPQKEPNEDPQAIAAAAALGQDVPNKGRVYNDLGLGLLDAEKPEPAIEYFKLSLAEDPTIAEAHINWGNALQTLGRTQAAVAHYQEALKIEPDFAEAHYNWGYALNALGRTQEAVMHYQEALRIKPDYVDAHVNLGNALAAQGRLSEAAAHYQHALRLKPDFPAARDNLSQIKKLLEQKTEPVRP